MNINKNLSSGACCPVDIEQLNYRHDNKDDQKNASSAFTSHPPRIRTFCPSRREESLFRGSYRQQKLLYVSRDAYTAAITQVYSYTRDKKAKQVLHLHVVSAQPKFCPSLEPRQHQLSIVDNQQTVCQYGNRNEPAYAGNESCEET